MFLLPLFTEFNNFIAPGVSSYFLDADNLTVVKLFLF